MKKLFAGIITCATILLTGIGVSATATDENNSGGENVKSEIVFICNSFDKCYAGNIDDPPESYKGCFIERNGNVRSFSFEDVNEHWTFGYVAEEDIPKTISLNKTTPQEKLLSNLTDVSKYQIIGKISEEELERNLNLLSDIDTNINIKMDISPLDVVQGYSETFGLRYDDNGNAEVVFLNGIGTIINKHIDENALEIDNWLRNLDISSDNPNVETTQPNPTENTTTTPVTTTVTIPDITGNIKGDADGNGKLTASDSAFIAKTLAEASINSEKIKTEDYPAMDFNQDGKVTAKDAADIARYLAEESIM